MVTREEWVAALRSGKYKQTTSTLFEPNEGFCCLGVACDLQHVDLGNWDSSDLASTDFAAVGAKNLYTDLKLTEEQTNTLGWLNDDGLTFEQIADLIEADWLPYDYTGGQLVPFSYFFDGIED